MRYPANEENRLLEVIYLKRGISTWYENWDSLALRGGGHPWGEMGIRIGCVVRFSYQSWF